MPDSLPDRPSLGRPVPHRLASSPKPADLLIDYGRAAEDYGRYRQGFPGEFFSRLQKMRVGLPGQRLLDLGTGTGLMAREFARRGCLVTGADFSARLLSVAERTNAGEVVRPRYLRLRAESTKLASNSFDVVSAGTSWHLFNRTLAAREARRLLRPEGRLVIAHLDWHPAPGSVAAATLRLMARYGPEREAPVTFLWPAWAEELMAAGFSHWEIFGFTCTLHYTPEAWRGRVRASKRGAAAMDKSELGKFDASLGRMLARRFPGPMLAVEHRVFAVVAC
jgi:SAM-dependent methyltransferase